MAGPDRPVAQPTPKDRVVIQDADPSGSGTPGGAYSTYSAQAQGMAASAATTASNLYSRLGAAFAERTLVYLRSSCQTSPLTLGYLDSENLGQLQESFDSLEQGSRKMLAQVSI